MAINSAIIRIRRGPKDDLRIDKLLPGELAMATDAPAMWFCWAPGNIEQVPTSENITEIIAEIIKEYLKDNPVTGISEIYMRVADGFIQYSSDNETWNNLLALEDITGSDGKTAYQYAQDGGYTGTEEQFSQKLAKEYPSKTSDLENDSEFITKAVSDLANYYLKSETYSKSEINQRLSAIPKFAIQVVASLPLSGDSTTVYLLKSGDEESNLYTEYIYVNGRWEFLGSQSIAAGIPTKLSELTNDTGYITKAVTDLANYYNKIASDNKYQPKGNYLTEHQDLSGYAKKATTLSGYGITDGATKEEFNQLSEEIDDQKKVYFKTVDGGIYVNAHYSEANDITFYLCKHGANSLFDFYSIGLVAKAIPTSKVTIPTKYIVQTSGDWHAPYVVKAVNNADGQMLASNYFTGGNHGYDNTATGVPTARCENLKMYADGKSLATGNEGYCDKIRIEWDNFVQAYNTTKANGTGREVLREHITMLFDGYKWNTETTIYPLEAIKIQTWYGLQFFTANYDYVAYINGATGLISAQSESGESGNATPNAMKFFNLEDTAIVEIDTAYDLGTRKHASTTTAGFFARGTYGKAYGTIINASTEFLSGGAYSLRGSYVFKHEVQQTPIYESDVVVSLLNLNRTASNASSYLAENCESLYINPAQYSTVAVTGTPCAVSNLTENSITVVENGAGGTGCAFPLGLTAPYGAELYGKTLTLTWDATGTTDTRFRLMCLGNSNVKYGDLDNKNGTKTSATIDISADGNTITLNGTAITSNGNPFTVIAFFFGAATGKTVAYNNVSLALNE